MKDTPIRIEVKRLDRTAIVRLEGRLVLGLLRDVEQKVTALIEEGAENLIVNLGLVTHIGSSGLGLMLGLRNKLDTAGGKLILAPVSPVCREALQLTRMDEILTIAEDEESALKQITGN